MFIIRQFHKHISSAGTLVISFIGLQTQEVKIQPVVKVVLKSDAEVLDEVMVVAYGTAKKSSFTGSASVVGGDKIESRPITNVTKALEGQTTGVLTTSGSGQPGESASIVIRGYGSINASQDPLYVVDGVPYDGTLSSINPSDIESMTILKDASAGALYGARGANGVVMITTKQGKEGKTNVTWRSTAGWSSRAIPEYETVSQKDFVQLSYEAARNSYAFGNGYSWEQAEAMARASLARNLGGSAGELYNPFKNYTWDQLIDPATGQVRADAVSAWNEPWLDAVQQNGAFRHEHQLSLSGGSAKTKYMFSLGYVNEDGILTNTGFQRYNGRANITSDVTDWFKANMNVSLTHSIMNYSQYEDTSQSNVWYSAQFISPLLPVYIKDENGNNLLDSNGNPQLDYGESGRPGSYDDYNPLGGLIDDKSLVKNDVASLRTGFTLGGDKDEFGVFKGLKFSVNFGMDYRNQNQMDYMNMYHGNQANAGGLLQKYSVRMQSYTFNQILTWNRTFGLHNFDVMAGHEFYAYQYEYLSAGRTGLVDGILELRPGAVLYDADSYTDNYRIESWFGRFNYNFDEKYYFSASLRTDGSSRFYKDNRWGTFWSVGGNWRVSKEEFMKDLTWINNLSVKLSYGQQGNDNILDANGNPNYYLWQGLYDLSWTNENNPGAMPSSLENRSLTWEKNGNLNVGIEALLLDHRLSINAEYYNKKTTDMLLSYPMATSTGYNGYNANVGSMRNSGFEFEIRGTLVKTEDLTWNLSWMGSTVKNKVLELTGDSPEIISGIYSIKEGMPINTFYMAKSAGVDPATGAQLYWVYDTDENGNKIGEDYISSDYNKANNSKHYLGSRIPDLYGSISTDLTWKGIDLSILTTYSIGGKIYDSLYAGSMNNMYYNNTWNVHALRRWQKPGDITDVPRIEIAGSYATNDRFLVDASYFAIKNITLGYTLPKVWMQKARLGSVRVFASVDNLALFTHLQGMDPQYNFSGQTNYAYTPNKTWSLGFEVNF
ncbi:TonB-dependent receptor plug [Phocaeicola salanitronis DSM 18170]|uniref:TonB-dependent receptor plug n=1 Tax=Phocaeicola salanitronis (strain DSM 18170 / JCM 13657 / CCUG 60908 / BL78) TaxID=667015 RepID=F0R1E8_PHOSB|nr:TonB-dependent receptor [Phocaeicola salanitronis]ADY37392.1 TonB-dependent receptor plug [Phocaeicola salanitronis DSM 18170]